jgi:hypothetical protein
MDLRLLLLIALFVFTGAALFVVGRKMRMRGSPRVVATTRLIAAVSILSGICLIGRAGWEILQQPTDWWHHMGAVPLGAFVIVLGILALTKRRQSTDA